MFQEQWVLASQLCARPLFSPSIILCCTPEERDASELSDAPSSCESGVRGMIDRERQQRNRGAAGIGHPGRLVYALQVPETAENG
jgi:hypothetical protein